MRVGADFMGSLLWMILPKMPGRSYEIKAQNLFLEMQEYYRTCPADVSRFDTLTRKMIKQDKKVPKLRGKAGEVRGIVNFCELAAVKYLDNALGSLGSTAISAMKELKQMYGNLSAGQFETHSLRDHCRRFCLLYSALAEKEPELWRLKPKTHLMQELCEMCPGTNPSLFWTYRDEDFGGTIAKMSRRRGGKNSSFSTAQCVLAKFRAQNSIVL